MIRPFFSLFLSLSLIPTGLSTTNISYNHPQDAQLQIIQQDTSLNFKKTSFSSYNSSFQHYLDYTLPAIQTQKRLEEEAAAKLKAEQEAREQEAEAQRQQEIAAQQAKAKLQVAQVVAPMSVAPVQASAPANFDYVSLIRERCAELGCNPDQMLRVMYCESGGRATAYNPRGGYSGLFQQDPRYWPARASAAGVPGADIFDAYAQIIVATNMFASGQAGHWSCR